MLAPLVFTDDHGYTFARVLEMIKASGQTVAYVPAHLWGVPGEQRNPNDVLVIMTGAQWAELEKAFRAWTDELLTTQLKYGVPVFIKG